MIPSNDAMEQKSHVSNAEHIYFLALFRGVSSFFILPKILYILS